MSEQIEIIRALFREILEVRDVGPEDNFFLLGGNSLMATRVISRIRSALRSELPLRSFFENPTAAGLAARLRAVEIRRPELVPVQRSDRIPLSFAQQRLWFINQLEGPNATYNIPVALRIEGEVDIAALRSGLAEVTRRHESLRTIFPMVHGEPCQLILSPDPESVLEVTEVGERDVAKAIRLAAHHEFDLTQERPLRAQLFVSGRELSYLLLIMHHIAGDGWSMVPLARDLSQAYNAYRRGVTPGWTPLPVQYADYALWQRALLTADGAENEMTGQLSFWESALADLPEQIQLPTDYPRPAVASYSGHVVRKVIAPDLRRRLGRLADDCSATLFMVLQSGVAGLLTRMGAGSDIPLGTPVAGRTDIAIEDLAGFFVNTLVLRTDTAGDPTFRQLIRRVRDFDLKAFSNQEAPFDRVVRAVNPARSLARNPLFQVMLVLQNNAAPQFTFDGLKITIEEIEGDVATFDLSLSFSDPQTESAGLDFSLQYRSDLFAEQTIGMLADRLILLLDGASADPDAPMGSIEILTDQERHDLLDNWAGTSASVCRRTFSDMFAAQAARTPDGIALESGSTTLTYAGLNNMANRLARVLVGRGAGPEDIVAVAIPRSAEMIISILAVAKTGAAFLLLDTDYPAERISYMIRDSSPACVLTTTQFAQLIAVEGDRQVLVDAPYTTSELDRIDGSDLAQGERTRLLTVDSPAYVVYTSGSTGRPKGVVVPHGGLANLEASQRERFGLSSSDRVLQLASVSFDAAVEDLLAAFGSGATLVLPPPGVIAGEELADFIEAARVTYVEVSPSVLATVPKRSFPSLTKLNIGGEACPGDLAASWAEGRTMLNTYGPVEATVTVTMSDPLSAQATPPIGRPVHGTRAYVLDEQLRPVPRGVVGELYIAGEGLARCYLNRAALTAARFVANPFGGSGTRLYRTGDRARWDERGELHFVGRADAQIKIRGVRIEPGEIEIVLREHPAVTDAAVVAREDMQGNLCLVAYVVSAAESQPSPRDLRGHAARTLPAYMLPAAFVMLRQLPVTPNGKLDIRGLPRPEFTAVAGRPPRSPREKVLCELFSEVLGTPVTSIDEDFFGLGGHSLLATRLVTRIRSVMGAELSVRRVFEAPTVAELADHVQPGKRARPRLTRTAHP
jgi:nonribosomal peptide synthetase DhbF